MITALIRFVTAFALAGGTLGFVAVPGTHRALAPGFFGMIRIAPNAYIDDAAKSAQAIDLIARARASSAVFFGETGADPTYVICTRRPCHRVFGSFPRGLTIGHHLVLIAPSGLNELILTHEQIHVDLHSFMGPRDLIDQRFPAWFDEGLASFLTGDQRLNLPRNPRDADWVKRAQTFSDWRALLENRSWQDSYGAAYRLVAEIEGKIGRGGLRALVDAVAGGADFDAELARLTRR